MMVSAVEDIVEMLVCIYIHMTAAQSFFQELFSDHATFGLRGPG